MASEESAGLRNPALGANLSESATFPSAANFSQPDSYTQRARSLKRNRPEQSQNFTLSPITNTGLTASPSPKSPRFKGAFSPSFSPIALTGAAALDDLQRKRREEESQRQGQNAMSENPSHKALSSLMAGGGTMMSKPQDALVPTASMSEGLSAAANAISIPNPAQFDEKPETSPASVTSLASLVTTAQTVTAGSTVVASPASMTNMIEAERKGNGSHLQLPADEQSSNRALSFPGNLLARPDASRGPQRGLSLPMPGQSQGLAARSPSQKKHKCPYCETEFTRHHNLKSHLLTHSQEKPYVCQTCNMRFRRLHDLKRHMKLHTGERPHICPKCDRKFARGDALARHSKGQGGCAGRRLSTGSFGDNDDFDGSNAGDADEGMDGVMYTNGTPNPNEGEMTEEERRRFSLPSIKAQHVESNHSSVDNYGPQSRTPSTYPPAGPRPGQSTGGLYPPNTDRVGSTNSATSPSMQSGVRGNRTPSTSISSLPLNTAGGSMFSQSGITESPKPLSPGGILSHQLGNENSLMNRQRSPSLTTQFQQQHFGRRQSGRSPPQPPGMSLPSPRSSHSTKLPALAPLAPPDQRYTLSSQTPTQSSAANGSQGQHMQQQSGSSSTSSIFQPSQSSGSTRGGPTNPINQQSSVSNEANNIFAYVQQMEERVKQLTEKVVAMESKDRSQEEHISRLTQEVYALRSQLDQNQPQHQPTQS